MIFNNIKRLCAKRNISISQLEKEAGLGNGTISGWKESSPTVANLQAVAKVLHCSVDDLLADGAEGGREDGDSHMPMVDRS